MKRTVWVAASSFALGVAFFLDGPVDAALQLPTASSFRPLARWLTEIGEWWAAGIVGLGLAAYFRKRGKLESARLATVVTLTGLATGFVGTLLRSTIGRSRPDAGVPDGVYGFWRNGHLLLGQYEFSSFPSGHAATLIGLAVAAWTLNRRLGIGLACFATMVSWSRVAQSSHHFSDIVAAAILALWLAPWLQKRFETLLSAKKDVTGTSRPTTSRHPRARPALAR